MYGDLLMIPDGVMFHQGEGDPVALLKWKGRAWAWSPEGYEEGPRMDQGQPIEVLTQEPGIKLRMAGFPAVRSFFNGRNKYGLMLNAFRFHDVRCRFLASHKAANYRTRCGFEGP